MCCSPLGPSQMNPEERLPARPLCRSPSHTLLIEGLVNAPRADEQRPALRGVLTRRRSGSMFYSASPGCSCRSSQSTPLSELQRNCCLQTALEPTGLDLTPPHSGDSFDRANLGAELSSGVQVVLQSGAPALSVIYV
ncbi:uncharacterized [Tachysurus ichikawai]